MAVRPDSPEALAAELAEAGAHGRRARVRGGATKLNWGNAVAEPDVELETGALDAIVEHNAGDLTAVLQAGVPLARAQATFSEAGQMLALDPPLGAGDAATVGGVVATGDSGPGRHRYGAARDLVLGITVALSDGAIARAGGKVIKNVAGYDLAKLFSGSFGTLGAILEVSVRLHARPELTATAIGRSDDPAALAEAASDLAHRPLEHEALDLAWERGRGAVLARFAGASAQERALAAVTALRDCQIEADFTEDEDALWTAQRERQRSDIGTVVRVSTVQTGAAAVLAAAHAAGARVVGRAGLGLLWVAFEDRSPDEQARAVVVLRSALAPAPCVVLDAPAEVRAALDPWGADPHPLQRRIKARFDPAAACNPGVFAGGI